VTQTAGRTSIGNGKALHCGIRGTDTKIEELSIGDLPPTFFGGMTRIQWIGRYRFKRSNPAKSLTRKEVRKIEPLAVIPAKAGTQGERRAVAPGPPLSRGRPLTL
jgi:hypothetical protein